ncbi:paeninodin family lasso peptide [Paenibacillus sp. MWE-103]|uniref:Paeninodin family lasso peptide n=1 Tax=Paenibacillus artemisiicola TaxID=1172618 RepID=A0ABS3WHJ9_9BACL|nr:paeninodin family lasso peptide [Paenibacillus artemisiicola]MBO7747799.1 paeninodin family lasso peptide [Paenibacillus artemisiicola]
MKKVWEAPTMEVLEVSQTMAGFGVNKVDSVVFDKDGNPIDADLYS